MATYTNLAGGGAQGLSPNVTRLYVDVVTFGKVMSTGRAAPTNYFHLGLLRLGVQGSYYPAIPIDAAQMVIDVPQGVTTLGYSLQDTTTITVIEVFGTSPWSRPAWYDRNPGPVVSNFNGFVNGGTPATTGATYTVPAARLLMLADVHGLIARNTLPTTRGNIYCIAYITGVASYTLLLPIQAGQDAVSGSVSPSSLILQPGQQIYIQHTNTDTGGQAYVEYGFTATAFDA